MNQELAPVLAHFCIPDINSADSLRATQNDLHREHFYPISDKNPYSFLLIYHAAVLLWTISNAEHYIRASIQFRYGILFWMTKTCLFPEIRSMAPGQTLHLLSGNVNFIKLRVFQWRWKNKSPRKDNSFYPKTAKLFFCYACYIRKMLIV